MNRVLRSHYVKLTCQTRASECILTIAKESHFSSASQQPAQREPAKPIEQTDHETSIAFRCSMSHVIVFLLGVCVCACVCVYVCVCACVLVAHNMTQST